MIVFNGEGAIVGRLGSRVAKELLKGNSVVVINSERAILSGKKEKNVERIIKLRQKGGTSLKGPKISKLPERLLKRMIRGMLPWDRQKGRDAYKRLKCYVGGGDLKEEEIKKAIELKHIKPLKSTTIKQISEALK